MAKAPYIENEVESVRLNHGIVSKFGADFSNAIGTFKFPQGVTSGMLDQTVDVTANVTLTTAQSNANILLDIASGATVTLPLDSPGLVFNFFVATTVTSNTYKVIIQSASSFFCGQVDVPVAAGTRKNFYGDGSTLLSINLNGTTTGGLQGGYFTLVCLKAGLWSAQGSVEGSGTVATPFATS